MTLASEGASSQGDRRSDLSSVGPASVWMVGCSGGGVLGESELRVFCPYLCRWRGAYLKKSEVKPSQRDVMPTMRVVIRRGLCAGATLALAAGVVFSTDQRHAQAGAACTAENRESGLRSSDLQRIIDLANPKDTLRVVGHCVGFFHVGKDLTLRGRATTTWPHPALDGDRIWTVLRIHGAGTRVKVVNLTVTGGRANSGGGIVNDRGTLILQRSTVRNNVARYIGRGGGIYNRRGTVVLKGTTVRSNIARHGGGGGGIFSRGGNVTVKRSAVRGNSANDGPGGGIRSVGGSLQITNSTVSFNRATGMPDVYLPRARRGGGIYSSKGTVLVTGSSAIAGNQVVHHGYGGGIYNRRGEVYVTNSATISSNSAHYGGGIFNARGTISMKTSSSITGNAGFVGGGLLNRYGAIRMDDATSVRRNSARRGGGIFTRTAASSVVLSDTSAAVGNTATKEGGGLYVVQGTVTLRDRSAVRSNRAGVEGGGVLNDGRVLIQGHSRITENRAGGLKKTSLGGGVSAQRGAVTSLRGEASIDSNHAEHGGGLYNDDGILLMDGESLFRGNRADRGGAVFNKSGLVALRHKSSITKNRAADRGGGILNRYGDLVGAVDGGSVHDNVPDNIFDVI